MIVDDEKPMLEWLSILLEQQGYSVTCFNSGKEAVSSGLKEMPDILVVDVKMPGISGLDVLSQLRMNKPDLIGIVMTAFSSVDSAVEAMRKGATDYLIKPFEVDQLLVAIDKALGEQRIRKENQELKRRIRSRFHIDGIIGKSKPIIDLLDKIRMVADKDSTVLITGESGTGKELVAQAIHSISPRAGKPFLGVNCGSFSRSLLESELFGHMRGSFTGAHKDKTGLLVAAKEGTFFLDEVSELDRELQVRLLRALQERQVLPVGAIRHIPFDARIIAATNADLKGLVDDGNFRADLYYRLNVIPLHVPSLRERTSDIPLLIEKFLENYSFTSGDPVRKISEKAGKALMDYPWPGNVRELENVVERICVMTRGDVISLEDLPDFLRGPETAAISVETVDRSSEGIFGGSGIPPTLDEIEKAYTLYVLEHRAKGQKRLAARLLGINESTLYRRLEKYSRGQDIPGE